MNRRLSRRLRRRHHNVGLYSPVVVGLSTRRAERAAEALMIHHVLHRFSRSPRAVPHSTTHVQAWTVDVPTNGYL